MKLHAGLLFLGWLALAARTDALPGRQEQDAWANQPGSQYESPCRNQACPDVWEPVCGCTCDGLYCRTFGNECDLRVYNCHNTPDYKFNRNGTCAEWPGSPKRHRVAPVGIKNL